MRKTPDMLAAPKRVQKVNAVEAHAGKQVLAMQAPSMQTVIHGKVDG
jgi:hypothetical protein